MAKDYGKIKVQLGEDLRIIRQKGNYSRVTLAKMTEVSRNEIMHIEQGRVMPSIEILDRLCHALGISLSDAVKVFDENKFIIKR